MNGGREAKLMFYKWLTPTGKLQHVTDTYTERIQAGRALLWTVDKAEAERILRGIMSF